MDGTLLHPWASHDLLEGVGPARASRNAATPPSPPSQPGQGLGKTTDTDSGGREKKRVRRDFHGKRLSNRTHGSSSDPDACLAHRGKAQGALLGFLGHVPMDNRHHLVVDSRVTLADGYGERDAAQQMVDALTGEHPRTIPPDKGYDTRGFVRFMGWRVIVPHVARNPNPVGGSSIDQRSRRHPVYIRSTDNRGLGQCDHRGRGSVGGVFLLPVIAYDYDRDKIDPLRWLFNKLLSEAYHQEDCRGLRRPWEDL